MKKLGICFVLVFFVIGMSCFAQSNDAQRIVGNWISPGGTPFTFSSNGTFSHGNDYNGRYFVNSGKIFTVDSDNRYFVYIYYLSSDGKALFIESSRGNYWLDRK